jgi:hypothetical protein
MRVYGLEIFYNLWWIGFLFPQSQKFHGRSVAVPPKIPERTVGRVAMSGFERLDRLSLPRPRGGAPDGNYRRRFDQSGHSLAP